MTYNEMKRIVESSNSRTAMAYALRKAFGVKKPKTRKRQ